MDNKDQKYLNEMESFIKELNEQAEQANDYSKKNNIFYKSVNDSANGTSFNLDSEFNKLSNAINSIEESIENSEGFDEEEISKLKEKIKIFENKLKEKCKPKTITISKISHDTIKNYCNFYNIKIGDWVEKTLLEKIDDQTPKHQMITKEEQIKDIKDKYKNDIFRFKVKKKLIMSDKYLGVFNDECVRKNFKFVGINLFKKPVYEYIGGNYEKDTTSIGCGLYEYKEGESINTFVKYQKEFDNIEIDNGSRLSDQNPSIIYPIDKLSNSIFENQIKNMELKNDAWVDKLGDINPKTSVWETNFKEQNGFAK
jgi:hypothetical protein